MNSKDYKGLIKQLKYWNEQYISEMCGDGELSCIDLCDGGDCIVQKAIDAIETLLAERDAAKNIIKNITWCSEDGVVCET